MIGEFGEFIVLYKINVYDYWISDTTLMKGIKYIYGIIEIYKVRHDCNYVYVSD